jgi:hypothetical protein
MQLINFSQEREQKLRQDCKKLIELYDELFRVRSEIDLLSNRLRGVADRAFDVGVKFETCYDPEIEIRA